MSKATKYTVPEIESMLPDDAIREAFMRREDMTGLPESERERRWQEHRVKVGEFFRQLSELPAFVVPAKERGDR